MSRKPHKPTEKDRKYVEQMAAVGTPQEDSALTMDIDPKTLRKYYRKELDTALIKANAKIGSTLYNKAASGDTSSIIWWEKTRNGKSDKMDHTSGGKPLSVNINRVIHDPNNTE